MGRSRNRFIMASAGMNVRAAEREQGELRDTEEGDRHRRRVEVSEHVW
jgi:hypothetical protein